MTTTPPPRLHRRPENQQRIERTLFVHRPSVSGAMRPDVTTPAPGLHGPGAVDQLDSLLVGYGSVQLTVEMIVPEPWLAWIDESW